jgi:hypothetical protein
MLMDAAAGVIHEVGPKIGEKSAVQGSNKSFSEVYLLPITLYSTLEQKTFVLMQQNARKR